MKNAISRQTILVAILLIVAVVALVMFLSDGSQDVATETQVNVPTPNADRTNALSVFLEPQFVELSGGIPTSVLSPLPAYATNEDDPLPPEQLRALDMKVGGKALVSWNAPRDATVTSYTVYRTSETDADQVTVAKSLKDTSIVDQELNDGELYSYAVYSVASDGTESTRYAQVEVVPSDQSSPASPTNVKQEDTDEGSVALTWELSSDEDVVEQLVFRADQEGELGEVIAVLTATENSYEDADIAPETDYYYSIVASDEAGNTSPVLVRPSSGRTNPFERLFP